MIQIVPKIIVGDDMPVKTRHWATRPYQYGRQQLDRGQVFDLAGLPNDEVLIRLWYAKEVEKDAQTYFCDECGAEFVDMQARAGHVRKQHPPRPISAREMDALLDNEERLLNQVAPIPWEKTKAAQKG